MTEAARYGNRLVPKMYRQVNALRRLIAAEGTPGIQDAWAKIEEHIDFAYGQIGKADNQKGSNLQSQQERKQP